MRIGSLFAGIGGFELGLESAGVGSTVYQVECDPFCLRVLAKHWPEAKRFHDVEQVGRADLPPVDLLCGGFPCQDVSVAGAGAGLDGERSGLWREFARIIGETRPAIVVVENVSHGRDRWLPQVRRDLVSLGYCATPYRLAASDVGANHSRQRIFVAAYSDRESLRKLKQRAPEGRQARRVRDQGQGVSMVDGAEGGGGNSWSPHWSAFPRVRGVDDGIPSEVDRTRLKALGNAIVPQVAEVIGRKILQIVRDA